MKGTIGIFVLSVEGGKWWPLHCVGFLVRQLLNTLGLCPFRKRKVSMTSMIQHLTWQNQHHILQFWPPTKVGCFFLRVHNLFICLNRSRKWEIDLLNMPQQFNLVGGYWFGVNPTSGRYRVNKIFRYSPKQLMILEFNSKMKSCGCRPVDNKSFTPSWNNLIFCDGSLFGLDQNGKFGIFATVGNGRQWHVLNGSQLLCFPSRVQQS